MEPKGSPEHGWTCIGRKPAPRISDFRTNLPDQEEGRTLELETLATNVSWFQPAREKLGLLSLTSLQDRKKKPRKSSRPCRVK